jgi:CHAT domain-containing protein
VLNRGLRSGFANLPGTEVEARRTVKLFERAFPKEAVTLLTGAEAGKGRLRQALARPVRVLHFAGHGFFAPPREVKGDRLRTGISHDALRRELRVYDRAGQLMSGLVLAGAAVAERGADSDDGILTAEEVAGLDLRSCELAVLSACETALGAGGSGEGPQGLQRAFHLAGARALVTSLWKVDDAATALLMEEFYANLWGKKLPRLEALRQAQIFLLRNPEKVAERRKELERELATRGLKLGAARPLPNGGKVEGRSHPALWAAFVLSGDPR